MHEPRETTHNQSMAGTVHSQTTLGNEENNFDCMTEFERQKRFQSQSAHFVFDVSYKKLYDLNFVEDLAVSEQPIGEIKLVKNYLSDVDQLSELKSLKKIYANDNFISVVNLCLPKL